MCSVFLHCIKTDFFDFAFFAKRGSLPLFAPGIVCCAFCPTTVHIQIMLLGVSCGPQSTTFSCRVYILKKMGGGGGVVFGRGGLNMRKRFFERYPRNQMVFGEVLCVYSKTYFVILVKLL